jgi:palmitoyltransferase
MWVNNCRGRGNYKFFLALLLSTTASLVYAALLACLTVAPQVGEHLARRPAPRDGGDDWRWADLLLAWLSYCLNALGAGFAVGGIARSGVGLLALLTAPLPAGLLAYHLHLIRSGITTKESSKWSDWHAEPARGASARDWVRCADCQRRYGPAE